MCTWLKLSSISWYRKISHLSQNIKKWKTLSAIWLQQLGRHRRVEDTWAISQGLQMAFYTNFCITILLTTTLYNCKFKAYMYDIEFVTWSLELGKRLAMAGDGGHTFSVSPYHHHHRFHFHNHHKFHDNHNWCSHHSPHKVLLWNPLGSNGPGTAPLEYLYSFNKKLGLNNWQLKIYNWQHGTTEEKSIELEIIQVTISGYKLDNPRQCLSRWNTVVKLLSP